MGKILEKVKSLFPKKQKIDNISDCYEFVEDEAYDDHWLIRLKSPPWTGITYRYTVVKLAEDKVADRLMVKFNYDIIGVPSNIRDVEFPDKMGEQLKELLGLILGDIMMNHQDELDKLTKKK